METDPEKNIGEIANREFNFPTIEKAVKSVEDVQPDLRHNELNEAEFLDYISTVYQGIAKIKSIRAGFWSHKHLITDFENFSKRNNDLNKDVVPELKSAIDSIVKSQHYAELKRMAGMDSEEMAQINGAEKRRMLAMMNDIEGFSDYDHLFNSKMKSYAERFYLKILPARKPKIVAGVILTALMIAHMGISNTIGYNGIWRAAEKAVAKIFASQNNSYDAMKYEHATLGNKTIPLVKESCYTNLKGAYSAFSNELSSAIDEITAETNNSLENNGMNARSVGQKDALNPASGSNSYCSQNRTNNISAKNTAAYNAIKER